MAILFLTRRPLRQPEKSSLTMKPGLLRTSAPSMSPCGECREVQGREVKSSDPGWAGVGALFWGAGPVPVPARARTCHTISQPRHPRLRIFLSMATKVFPVSIVIRHLNNTHFSYGPTKQPPIPASPVASIKGPAVPRIFTKVSPAVTPPLPAISVLRYQCTSIETASTPQPCPSRASRSSYGVSCKFSH